MIEAAGRPAPISFVASSSGPRVTPAEQERYSHRTYLAKAGLSPNEIDEAVKPFDDLVGATHAGLAFESMRTTSTEATFRPFTSLSTPRCFQTTPSSGTSCSRSSTTTRGLPWSESAFRRSRSSEATMRSCRSTRASRCTAKRFDPICSLCRPPRADPRSAAHGGRLS
jgi:hypothetical protein